MINFDLTKIDNTMALCGVCHAAFDDSMNPSFVFVPSDLEFFISYEKQNFEERQILATRGAAQPRRCPTAVEYRDYQIALDLIQSDANGGFYRRVILDNLQPNVLSSIYMPLKIWYGAPMAAIRRAFIALGSISASKIPSNVREQLRTLQDLYARDDPPIRPNERRDTALSQPSHSVQTSESGGDSHVCGPNDSAHHQSQQPSKPKNYPQSRFSPAQRGQSQMAGETWILGPMSTSTLAIERYGSLFV
jgi:hypothetical protein